MNFHLVMEGGIVITAANTMQCDIGIAGGNVVAFGHELGPAARRLDSSGMFVLPSGIDNQVHLSFMTE